MPELPEVHTTVLGIKKRAVGLTINDVWSNYNSSYHHGKNNIKNLKYFDWFKKNVIGAKIISSKRRAKNVLIELSNGYTILVHMKMTGHIMYGDFVWNGKEWQGQGPALSDPFNRFIRLIFTLSDGKYLALSDMRRFAKVCLFKTSELDKDPDIANIGPEPLEKSFTLEKFKECLMQKPKGKIKQILLDQSIIAGIGNIYSDEMLWSSGIHPLSQPKKIPGIILRKLFLAMKEVLKKGIDFGGDSMSDYRNIDGKRGKFQNEHNAYRLTGKKCRKKGCKGIMSRMQVGARNAHFCPIHQKRF